MRKLFLACASVLGALALMGPASAFAQSPELAVCLGAGQSDGSFAAQQINTGPVPGVGISLGQNACVVASPDNGSEWLDGFANRLSEAEPPSEPPSQEDIDAIVEAIQNADPENPFSALILATTICQHTGLNDYCTALIGGALTAPVPTGNVNLEGESGSCFGGTQSGTGRMSGGGTFYNLEWTADYASGGNAVGVVSGTATRFGEDPREVTGLVGPGCGAGAKALVLVIN